MTRISALLTLLSLIGAVACTEDSATGVGESAFGDAEAIQAGVATGPGGITIMTRNIYVGANVDRVLAASSPEEIPALVEESWQELLATNFPERAGTIADEIKRFRPHLIGLQEVSLIRTQSPGDAIVGGTVPAETVVFDFLEILLASLEARGLRYEVAGMVQDTDFEAPRANATFDDVRLTDFDVILARSDVVISNVVAQNFQARFSIPLGAAEIPILRGFVAVDAKVGGRVFRFVNTHLEPETVPTVQIAQGDELIQILSDEELPVVVVGDFNSRPDASDTPTYRNFLAAGYVDVWTRRLGPHEEGLTCCQDSDLANAQSVLEKRIDFILVRPRAGGLGPTRATVLGDEVGEKTPSGLWPSDHAGVVAGLRARMGSH